MHNGQATRKQEKVLQHKVSSLKILSSMVSNYMKHSQSALNNKKTRF